MKMKLKLMKLKLKLMKMDGRMDGRMDGCGWKRSWDEERGSYYRQEEALRSSPSLQRNFIHDEAEDQKGNSQHSHFQKGKL